MGQPAIGIFALQGDIELHTAKVRELGIEPVFVRMPEQLDNLDGLIIPGGESTTYLKLTEPIGLDKAIVAFAQRGRGIFATCAGTIMIAKEVTNPAQRSLDLLDITVERNSYGRQLESAEVIGEAFEPLGHGPLPMTFIRAPRIVRVGDSAHVLAKYRDDIVAVQYGRVIAVTFHPELSSDLSMYRHWFSCLAQDL